MDSTPLALIVEGQQAQVEILTFCSRDQPTIVCQEIAMEVDGACDASVTAIVDLFGLAVDNDKPGYAVDHKLDDVWILRIAEACHIRAGEKSHADVE